MLPGSYQGSVATTAVYNRQEVRNLSRLIQKAWSKKGSLTPGQTAHFDGISDGVNSSIKVMNRTEDNGTAQTVLIVTQGQLNRYFFLAEENYQELLTLLDQAANH